MLLPAEALEDAGLLPFEGVQVALILLHGADLANAKVVPLAFLAVAAHLVVVDLAP